MCRTFCVLNPRTVNQKGLASIAQPQLTQFTPPIGFHDSSSPLLHLHPLGTHLTDLQE